MRHEVFPVTYRAPFDFGARPYFDERPYGESILQIVQSIPGLPSFFMERGVVCINGEVVPRNLWAYVRPRPATRELPIAVTLHWTAAGGGPGSTAKTVVSLVAALALVVVTAGIASGALIPAGLSGFATSSFLGITGAQVLAGAVGLAGALAISALTAPPTTAGPPLGTTTSDNNTDQKESAGATGNILNRGGAIPRIVGTRKIFPPLAGEPIVELIGTDEYVEALFILNGPHLIQHVAVDGALIADADDIEYEIREGWEADTPINLVRRQGRTITPQLQLSYHDVNLESQDELANQFIPRDSVPLWHSVLSRNEPDEIWVHLLLPQGISKNAATTQYTIPFRMRMRLHGTSAWINFPEFHLQDATIAQLRKAILIKWKNSEPTISVPASSGFVFATESVDNSATDPDPSDVDSIWTAHSSFSRSGSTQLYSGAETTAKVARTNLFVNRIEFYIDEAQIPKGRYEVQIKRGALFQASAFTKSTYSYSGGANFFTWQLSGSTAVVPVSRSNVADMVSLIRAVSIWNDHPVKKTGFALLAVKAHSRSLQNVSVEASGYVRDWDGSAWSNWTTTSNPAPHYADILSGAQNIDPLPDDLRDDTGLVAWRTLCNTNGWTCDAIIDDYRTQDALSLLASCGYAQPYQSDQYGVIVDSDHSLETPMQVFSRRNANNIRFERSYPRVPDGFMVTYRDESLDDEQAQVVVYQRDRSIADATLLETISYDGLLDVDQVTARAQFDLDQGNQRSTFYYLDTDIESIVCRRGSLVALEHDILTKRAGDGYIKSKTLSVGSPVQITGFVLDSEIPITNELDMHGVADMHAVADMHDVGIETGIVIRRNDGTLSTHTLSNVTGSTATITLSIPFTDTAAIEGYDDTNHKYGSLVVAGQVGSIYRRLLVTNIMATKDLMATLTLVDEAPDLVRFSP